MASMDYCVFENTYADFSRCVEKVENGDELNQYELPYRERLYELAQQYIEAYENMLDEE